MTHSTIFGTGNMANSIGPVLAAGGVAVDYIAREDSGNAEITGSSAAAELQKELPDTAVLKTFNTNFGNPGIEEGRRAHHHGAHRR